MTSTVTPTEPSKSEPGRVEPGSLRLLILPWAEVAIDGKTVGTTPLGALKLDPGTHLLRLTHPNFLPLQRKVVIRPGETTRFELDLAHEAFPK
jgi:hypothetical protein